MATRLLAIVCSAMTLMPILTAVTSAADEPNEGITPPDAKRMISRFERSEKARKLNVEGTHSTCDAFIDPYNGWIRYGHWWIDTARQTVANVWGDVLIEGSFVKERDGYVVNDVHRVETWTIESSEAAFVGQPKMLLRFLSSPEAANLPSWVTELRRRIENPAAPKGERVAVSFEPYPGTVVLYGEDAAVVCRTVREGKDYVIRDATVRKVRRITPPEAKAMVLRFFDEHPSDPELTPELRKSFEEATPSVATGSPTIEIGRCRLGMLTNSWRMAPSRFGANYLGTFLREGNTYRMYMLEVALGGIQ
jgi:hypothetical protein